MKEEPLTEWMRSTRPRIREARMRLERAAAGQPFRQGFSRRGTGAGERDMIDGTTAASRPGADIPKAKPGEAETGARACGGGRTAAAVYASSSESLHLKYTSKDGDVLELDYQRREEVFAGVALSKGGAEPRDASGLAGGNAEAALPAGPGSEERLKRLAQLRDWAAQVADEVRKQQQRILEEFLKRSGRFEPGCEGRMIVVYAPPDGEADAEGRDCEEGVPEYWNAENTSDRIVHFATQMAEIAGGDSEFAETIVQAVADGFDQANAATGPLPGKAGELNKKTRELTFAKLSEWLEERKAGGYNLGARTEENTTPKAPHGIENHEQRQDRPVYSEGENRLG